MELEEKEVVIKVILDKNLAELYQVETGALNRAVKRNPERFPADFMFQLTKEEFENLICQFGTSSLRFQFGILESGHGGTRRLPYAFTEQGVAMLSSVLNSKRAIMVNIQIIRTFTKLRELLETNTKLRIKIENMEKKYNSQFKEVFAVIKKFFTHEERQKVQVGFRTK